MNTLSFLKDKQMLTAIKNSVDAAQHIECQQCRQKLLLEVKPMINHLKQAVAENDPRAHETLQKVYKTASALFSSECTSCRRRLIQEGRPLAQRAYQGAKPIAKDVGKVLHKNLVKLMNNKN